MDQQRYGSRIEDLAAAGQSCVREGLPFLSDFARAMVEPYARLQITADEAISAIMVFHRFASAYGRAE